VKKVSAGHEERGKLGRLRGKKKRADVPVLRVKVREKRGGKNASFCP